MNNNQERENQLIFDEEQNESDTPQELSLTPEKTKLSHRQRMIKSVRYTETVKEEDY